MGIDVRPLRSADIPVLYDLYADINDEIAGVELPVSPDQFARHLTAPRLYARTTWHDPAADVALAAEDAGKVVASGAGCCAAHSLKAPRVPLF